MLLAEDHPGFRRTLRDMLAREEKFEVVGEASDFASTLGQLAAHQADVLVLDLRLADGSIAERIEHLRAEAPDTQIVVITMHNNQKLADHALKAGAIGFVLKDTADEELVHAVRRAADDLPYTSPRLVGAPSDLARALAPI